jgi:hypothetical protein
VPCCRIKKKVTTTSSQEQGKAPPASALDSALSEIQGPKAMSTITKSSIDWDNFKEKEGIEEELETAGQDGYAAVARSLLTPRLLMLRGVLSRVGRYLAKRDFLQRCDERRFEIEKSERETQRSTKPKAPP